MNLFLGSKGWRHPEWVGNLYPDDLPEDWELAYYNTQFHCVWLEWEIWNQATAEEVQHWLQETRDGFLFLLEAPQNGLFDQSKLSLFSGRARLLSTKDPSLVWFDSQSDLTLLTQQLAALTIDEGYVISRDADRQAIERVSILLELLG